MTPAVEAAFMVLVKRWYGAQWQRALTDRNRAYWTEMAEAVVEAVTMPILEGRHGDQ